MSDADKKKVVVEKVEESNYGTQDDIDFTDVFDEADIASAIEMSFISHALSAHKEKVAPEKHPDFDGESCISCGDTIPEQRLKMGRIRCVYCQEEIERKNNLYGGNK